ncbi:MAG TPA: ribonuclease III [Polyangiaceae bacterium]|jgi:ribonuclease-3
MSDDPLQDQRTRLRARLGEIVGPGEIARLDEALTHPSYANEVSGAPDNQRLEFLGDAVLGLCVSELLSAAHPNADEGALTRMRSALVNAEALARWGRAEQLGACLMLGRGAQSGLEREQTNVIADAVEAVVAAVFASHGLDGARALVRVVAAEPMAESERLAVRDPKSALQERVQAAGSPAPRYRVLAARGPQHEQVFEVEVLVAEVVRGRGEGRSKRLAERAAADAALKALDEGESPEEPT